ncbi:hypothetical protein [Olivibacter sitiensis]|uniref:hypothetical protein n=1 Tax=Olivibacter sitiensis TaxID=376470 RepID=UPI0004148361|nr:hypothetical protein [Olivibacter sitiensis]
MQYKSQLKSFPILLAAFSLLACSKKEVPVNEVISYPLVVRLTGVEDQKSTRLFTKNGEVLDQTALLRFIGNFPLSDPEGMNAEQEDEDIITFTNDSTAFFGSSDIPYRVKKNSELEFGFLSERLMFFPPANGLHSQLDAYYIGKYNAPINAVPSPTGISYTGTELRLAFGDYQHFKLPILIYHLKRLSVDLEGHSQSIDASINKLFNEFNPNFIQRLGNNDTIAIQQSYVRFQK